jgi:hypothetical protein
MTIKRPFIVIIVVNSGGMCKEINLLGGLSPIQTKD